LILNNADAGNHRKKLELARKSEVFSRCAFRSNFSSIQPLF